MKILELNLKAFGPFTEHSIDLSSREAGLHLIYGPNEAGKSSTLRAIHDLLFGIPVRTSDNFRHPYTKMRLGGRLSNARGDVLEFVRRKGNKGTLRDASDKAALEDAALRPYLGTVQRELFTSLFGIDHEQLHEKSEEMLAEGNEIGKLLFSAAGVAHLQDREKSLRERMADLFLPSGRAEKPAINAKLKELEAKQSELRDLQASDIVWKKLRDDLEVMESTFEEVSDKYRRLDKERERLRRVQAGAKLVSSWKGVHEQLVHMQGVPRLSDDFETRRESAMGRLKRAEQSREDAVERLAELEAALDGLEVRSDLLLKREEIEGLKETLGSIRKARQDRTKLDVDAAALERQAQDRLVELGKPIDLMDVNAYRVSVEVRSTVQKLANRYSGILERFRNKHDECEKLNQRFADVSNELEQCGKPVAVEELRAVFERVQASGDLEEQQRQTSEQLQALGRDAETRIARLSGWSGTIDECERLPVPAFETIDRFENDFAKWQADETDLQRELKEVDEGLKQCEADLTQLEAGVAIPQEEDLQEARRQRDRGFQLVLQSWRGESPSQEEIDQWCEGQGAAGDLAEAYRRSMERADELSDRLRREAKRVAEKHEITRRQTSLLEKRESAAAKHDALQAQRERLDREWRDVWEPIGVDPRSPKEMRSWLVQHGELVTLAERMRDERCRADSLDTQINRHRTELIAALQASHVEEIPDEASLTNLLSLARRTLKEGDARNEQMRRLSTNADALQRDLEEAKRDHARAESELTEWREAWAQAMQSLDLKSDAPPETATNTLSHLDALLECCREKQMLTERIQGMDKDAAAFAEDVRALASEVAPELVDADAAEVVNELSRRLREATEQDTTRRNLQENQSRESDNLKEAETAFRAATDELQSLCKEAGCESYEELLPIQRRAEERDRFEKERDQLKEQLYPLCSGTKLEEFVAEVESYDADALPSRIQDLTRQIDAELQTRDEIREQITDQRHRLNEMDGGADAAKLAEEIEFLHSEIEDLSREYAVVQVATSVLQRGIERYRDENQGPIVERAGELFRRLTDGGFASIQPDIDDDGQPVLVGIRRDDTSRVAVEGMSDGTRDQLYLALRIATVEHWNERHEPMPFVIDDVLVNFDDQRAAAALRVFGTMATKTQVIFFTHHEHLLEIAEEAVPGDQLCVHRLRESLVAT